MTPQAARTKKVLTGTCARPKMMGELQPRCRRASDRARARPNDGYGQKARATTRP